MLVLTTCVFAVGGGGPIIIKYQIGIVILLLKPLVCEFEHCASHERLENTQHFDLTFQTSIMQDIKGVITVASDKKKVVKTAQMKNGVNKRRANERENVEHDATKRQKMSEENNEMSTRADNIINSIIPHSASPPVSNTPVLNENQNCSKTEESRELQMNDNGMAKQSETNERSSKFTTVVVKELLLYYKKDYFVNKNLFKFMVKTIVGRLMNSTICPGKSAYFIHYLFCIINFTHLISARSYKYFKFINTNRLRITNPKYIIL